MLSLLGIAKSSKLVSEILGQSFQRHDSIALAPHSLMVQI